MDRKPILVADDEESIRLMLRANLESEGYQVEEAVNGKEAVEAVKASWFNAVLLDIRMPDMGGIEALKSIHADHPTIPVIMMTAYGSIPQAVECLQIGASDYLTKPLDIEELLVKLERVLQVRKLQEENLLQKERLGELFDLSHIIGKSPAFLKVLETVQLVAPTDATVLILGETGTGKEIIANLIHEGSKRAKGPFVKVNCAALTETLLESELFGHEKGSFTGAHQRREGRFQMASKGSIFLDEIGDMSLATQAKVLRVLQGGEFEPVGSSQTIKVDVRVIAATNRDLQKEAESGNFRQDLFYRLNVVPLQIPPLRDRKEDIPLLAEYFLNKYSSKNRKKDIMGFEPKALDILIRHHWPGNVRELENAVERAVIMCRSALISPRDLPQVLQESGGEETPAIFPEDTSLKEMEKQWILQTLEKAEGNRTRAAEILGITRRTLQMKLSEYGITQARKGRRSYK
ncbi:MAG: sigma-54-dependent Fis family transcriptional regulator [Deltaproteobacteria bacterium]|nr:sigma-54-dependent Fis family transcriptional regulator [Deltaproteobacteria bacterium]